MQSLVTPDVIEGIVNGYLKKDFDNPTDVPDCHREWWEMCCDPHPFMAIAAPRGHAKSTAITLAYVVACIVFRERSFILIVSDTETQASFFLQDLKKALIENEDLVKTFGIKGLLKDAITDVELQFQDGKTVRILAKGSNQSLRGVKQNNQRPDLIVCDDLENDEIVMNPERRIKFQRWFTGSLLRLRSKNGIVRMVGTILHQDSQLQRLMPRINRKGVVDTPLKLYYQNGRQSSWNAALYRAHDKKMTQALWPQQYPVEWLKREREMYQEQGVLDIWSQEMLNEPLDEASAKFRRGDFKEMKEEDFRHNFHYYVGTDLALTEKTDRDYCAFVVGAVDESGWLHIVHVIHERMQSLEIEETIFALQEAYNPELFFFEKGQIWSGLEPHLLDRMTKSGVYLSYEALPSMTDKIARSSSIRSRIRAGAVKFDKNNDWYPDFEDELCKFPRGGHDDQVDAISLLGRGLVKFVEAPTDQELAEEAYEQEKINFGFYEDGRNAITGY